MKKTAALFITLCILISPFCISKTAHATSHNITAGSNGTGCNDGGYFTPGSITIPAGDTITFSVPATDPYAAGLEIHNFPGGNFTILPGASHTTPALVISVPNYYATWPSSGCQKGTGSVTVEQITTPPPPATPTPPPPAPAATVSHPPVSPPSHGTPPATLKLDKVSIGGDKIDTTQSISLDKSKSLTISGYTIPGGVVDLTIHSTVRNEIVRADTAGYWSFVIENLEPGNHTLEAKVTDQATHLTSENATLLKFAVTGKATPNTSSAVLARKEPLRKNTNPAPLAATLSIVLIISSALTFWIIKKRKKTTKQPGAAKPAEPIVPPTPPIEINPTA
jgi:hypothetical protein